MSKKVESCELICRKEIHMSKKVEFVAYVSKIYCTVWLKIIIKVPFGIVSQYLLEAKV